MTDNAISRRTFLSATAVTVGGLVAACEGEGSDRGDDDSERARTVIFDIARRVDTPRIWNTLTPGMRDDQGIQAALIEPLFILNYETAEIEPWLGESFTPNDTLDVWTLKIRDGVKWSDGEDFDADDFVFTINYLKNGPTEINFGHAVAMQDWVDEVRKIDKLTAEVRLTRPNPRFQLDWFSVKIYRCIVILPEHIWNDKDPLTFENYDPDQGWPVFTGPYKVTRATSTQFVYERNDDWWGAAAGFKELPAPERLEWVVAENEDVRVNRAANNEFDALEDITTGAYESLHGRNDNFVAWNPEPPYSWADPCTRLLSLNNAVEPWDDRDMRWAINFAVDKDEIVNVAYEGSTTKAQLFFPPYAALDDYLQLVEDEGLFDEFPIMEHNPDEAQRIIESKGYTRNGDGPYRKDGKELRLRIDTLSETTELNRYADVIAEQLARIGINATVRRLAVPTWAENLSLGRFEASTDFSACGSVSEPWFSMNVYHESLAAPVGKASAGAATSAGANVVRWKNSAYSSAVDAMANLPLGDPRIEPHFLTAVREWLRDLPFFPAAHAKKLYAQSTRYWTGWPTADDTYVHPPRVWNSSHILLHNLQRAST